LRGREVKNEYRQFERIKITESVNAQSARQTKAEHREKIQTLKEVEPLFAYKIEAAIESLTPSLRNAPSPVTNLRADTFVTN
jgi:hypothetical protein